MANASLAKKNTLSTSKCHAPEMRPLPSLSGPGPQTRRGHTGQSVWACQRMGVELKGKPREHQPILEGPAVFCVAVLFLVLYSWVAALLLCVRFFGCVQHSWMPSNTDAFCQPSGKLGWDFCAPPSLYHVCRLFREKYCVSSALPANQQWVSRRVGCTEFSS